VFEVIELKSIEKNKSSRVSSDLNEKLDEIKVRLGEKLYNELLRINDSDIRIWNAVKDKYESEINK
jgi:fibrillarin-like rRNA methylase